MVSRKDRGEGFINAVPKPRRLTKDSRLKSVRMRRFNIMGQCGELERSMEAWRAIHLVKTQRDREKK